MIRPFSFHISNVVPANAGTHNHKALLLDSMELERA